MYKLDGSESENEYGCEQGHEQIGGRSFYESQDVEILGSLNETRITEAMTLGPYNHKAVNEKMTLN